MKRRGRANLKSFNAGNESLFSNSMEQPYSADPNVVQYLNIDEIEPCKYQARTLFDEEKIQELANSIKEEGLVQPITVRRVSPGRYEIIAGERRYRAHLLLGESHIRAVELDKTDKQSATLSLIENVQRENLSPIEEALGYQKLIDSFNFSINKVAEMTGKSRSHIANILRVLNLPEAVKEGLHLSRITLGHAKILLSEKDANKIHLYYDETIDKELTVRELDSLVKSYSKKNINQKPGSANVDERTILNSDIETFKQLFSNKFGVDLDAKSIKVCNNKLIISLTEKTLSKIVESEQGRVNGILERLSLET